MKTSFRFEANDHALEALVRANPSKQPSFIYERVSTKTRKPVRTFIGFGRTTDVAPSGGEDAFTGLRREVSKTASSPDGARAILAFLSYEALVGSDLAADTPRQLYLRPDALLELEHETCTATLTGNHAPLGETIRSALANLSPSHSLSKGDHSDSELEALAAWTQNQTEAEFVSKVLALKRDMAGRADVAGAALSVEVASSLDVSPLAAYLVLRRINPSTCMFFVQDGDFALWGATSLPVLSVDGRRLVAETDGATRRVDPGDTGDWIPNSKEIAEYDLVVSTLRDDLDGVVDPDSIRLVVDREPRQYFNLQHLFAEMQGQLVAGVDAVEALRRLTPHGAATGYAKPGAIALIDRYDARPRGPYAGAVGVFGGDGSADAACVIRSAWKVGTFVRTRAGAKIVSGSDPAAEYQESVLKTLPLRRSVARAMRP